MPTVEVRWWSPFKTIGSVSVVHVNLSAETPWENDAAAWLDEQEWERYRRYEHEGVRRRFLLTRAALRAILCEELECENEQLHFEKSRYGKPHVLVNERPVTASFNVSHSGNHGLIAYSPEGLLGVDVEVRDAKRDLSLLVDTVLNASEKTALALAQGSERTHLFFKLWTLKEAILKASGEGLALDATSIKIPAAMLHGADSGTLCLSRPSRIALRIQDLGNQDFAAALAYTINAEQQ